MKKLLGIVVLGLLWCGDANSSVLKKCYVIYESGSDYTETSFNHYHYTQHYYEIDLRRNILTQVKVLSDRNFNELKKKAEEWDKIFPQFAGDSAPTRVRTTPSQIILENEDLITAEGTNSFKVGYVNTELYEKTTIDIKKKQVTVYTQSYQKLFDDGDVIKENYHITYQCEGDFSGSSSDVAAASGTAFFVSNKGYLLTNNHVVEGCKVSKIIYKNKEHDTSLISTDKTLDLALLKAKVKPKSYISFSKDEPKKLQQIIVAGYPLGRGLSDDLKINDGRISSLKGFENNSNEITVDIAINPGNSGGPIVNVKGQLVGIAVSGMSKDVTEGINFGIKASAAANFLKSNKISPSAGYMSFSMDDDKLVKLLEESTVYTFCE